MKEVSLHSASAATQMSLGLNGGNVILALERNPNNDGNPGWLVYSAEPGRAREIARTLLDAADMIEGKLPDTGQYDHSIEKFKDHHG